FTDQGKSVLSTPVSLKRVMQPPFSPAVQSDAVGVGFQSLPSSAAVRRGVARPIPPPDPEPGGGDCPSVRTRSWMRLAFRRSGFDRRAAIAADAGSGGIDQRHKHFLTAFVLAGAGVAKLTRSLLHALAAELRGRFGADRARDGRRLVPGQELQLAWKGGRSVLADDTQGQVGRAAEIVLMRETDAGFEFAAQGLAHQCVT